jgi:APA family basic amino acid/polyamine antiporter
VNEPNAGGFVRALTLTDATMLVAGTMIGSGIFIVSADIGRTLGSPGLLLAAWAVTGVLTLLGASAYAELAAMYPRAGGQYVFLREALGPLVAFLFGWTMFAVIQTGTIAAVAVAFGRFAGVLVPALSPERFAWFPQGDLCVAALGCRDPGQAIQVGLSPQRVLALASIWVLTAINLRGVRAGTWVQTVLTVVKTAALAALIVVGFTVGRDAAAVAANFDSAFVGAGGWSAVFTVTFATALVGSLFSSSAWYNVTFAAAEVRDPARTLPRALLVGTGLVSLLYVTANLSYLHVLPFAGTADGADVFARGLTHAAQDRVGTAVAEAAFGPAGATAMAAAILLSTFGANNGLILAGARVSYAMARDGLFFRGAGALGATAVPSTALVWQAAWASVLCLTGTYAQLLDYVVFAALVFYALTVTGLFVLRRTRAEVPRPVRAPGYPLLPAAYVAAVVAIAGSLLVAERTRTAAVGGLALLALGVPVYFLWRAAGPRPAVAA